MSLPTEQHCGHVNCENGNFCVDFCRHPITVTFSQPEKETQEERYNGFKVTIDDGFVSYEYRFPGGDHLSIHQIALAISSETGTEIESSKLITRKK